MYFKGDVIITDPCYIIKERKNRPRIGDYLSKELLSKPFNEFSKEEIELYRNFDKIETKWKEENPNDWEKCNYGDTMEALGFETYLTSDTEYGDWACTTFEEGTGKKLGYFCADAGLVSVFLLEEVLKYNPDYKDHLEDDSYCVTLIKDFNGDIRIIHREYKYFENEEETVERKDVEVSVVGRGNVNFYTTQTGV